MNLWIPDRIQNEDHKPPLNVHLVPWAVGRRILTWLVPSGASGRKVKRKAVGRAITDWTSTISGRKSSHQLYWTNRGSVRLKNSPRRLSTDGSHTQAHLHARPVHRARQLPPASSRIPNCRLYMEGHFSLLKFKHPECPTGGGQGAYGMRDVMMALLRVPAVSQAQASTSHDTSSFDK